LNALAILVPIWLASLVELVAGRELKAARDRKRATGVKVEGRKSYAEIDAAEQNPGWRKWLPTWPTSAHWYDKSRFRQYMAAHIANRDSMTVLFIEKEGFSELLKELQLQ
jgi:hypothetical protein